MAEVEFQLNGISTIIPCKFEEKMLNICQRYALNIKINIGMLYFTYNNQLINYKFTFNHYSKKEKIIINVHEINKNINNEDKIENKENNHYDSSIYKSFKKNPHLKYKMDITNINLDGLNDLFDVYIPNKDNQTYIAAPNKNIINIYLLKNMELIISLKKNNFNITFVKYFINNKNKKEYLLSADLGNYVMVYDINNDYSLLQLINTDYLEEIQILSCLIISDNHSEVFIITSSYNPKLEIDSCPLSAAKIFSLKHGNFVSLIHTYYYLRSNIFYLLSWYNKYNKEDYVIELAHKEILIFNLYWKDLYHRFSHDDFKTSGFIYIKNNHDYLCTSSQTGYINIYDLIDKIEINKININNSNLGHIIQWNSKYAIVADFLNKSFKILDLEFFKIISNIENNNYMHIVKKVYHPKYGESLLTADSSNLIKLWTL